MVVARLGQIGMDRWRDVGGGFVAKWGREWRRRRQLWEEPISVVAPANLIPRGCRSRSSPPKSMVGGARVGRGVGVGVASWVHLRL